MSKTRIIVHIVFTTKNRVKAIPMASRRRLFAFMHAVITNKGCTTLRINGMSDHVHILVNIHPSISIATLVKDLKLSTSQWLKTEYEFNLFEGWNEGYYAASIGTDGIESCINYIMNQEVHHRSKNFLQEVKELSTEYKLDWDERDW